MITEGRKKHLANGLLSGDFELKENPEKLLRDEVLGAKLLVSDLERHIDRGHIGLGIKAAEELIYRLMDKVVV